jgi:hypothetical protein
MYDDDVVKSLKPLVRNTSEWRVAMTSFCQGRSHVRNVNSCLGVQNRCHDVVLGGMSSYQFATPGALSKPSQAAWCITMADHCTMIIFIVTPPSSCLLSNP